MFLHAVPPCLSSNDYVDAPRINGSIRFLPLYARSPDLTVWCHKNRSKIHLCLIEIGHKKKWKKEKNEALFSSSIRQQPNRNPYTNRDLISRLFDTFCWLPTVNCTRLAIELYDWQVVGRISIYTRTQRMTAVVSSGSRRKIGRVGQSQTWRHNLRSLQPTGGTIAYLSSF